MGLHFFGVLNFKQGWDVRLWRNIPRNTHPKRMQHMIFLSKLSISHYAYPRYSALGVSCSCLQLIPILGPLPSCRGWELQSEKASSLQWQKGMPKFQMLNLVIVDDSLLYSHSQLTMTTMVQRWWWLWWWWWWWWWWQVINDDDKWLMMMTSD